MCWLPLRKKNKTHTQSCHAHTRSLSLHTTSKFALESIWSWADFFTSVLYADRFSLVKRWRTWFLCLVVIDFAAQWTWMSGSVKQWLLEEMPLLEKYTLRLIPRMKKVSNIGESTKTQNSILYWGSRMTLSSIWNVEWLFEERFEFLCHYSWCCSKCWGQKGKLLIHHCGECRQWTENKRSRAADERYSTFISSYCTTAAGERQRQFCFAWDAEWCR